MTESELLKLLDAVRSGKLAPASALAQLKHLPFEDLDFAKVDHHRALRQGFAEVVFGKGKTARQVAEIVKSLLETKARAAERAGDAGRRENVCGGEAGRGSR